eukprot:COSAG02_NODE_880_length_16242_cov_5.512946_5_plen_186_part_00
MTLAEVPLTVYLFILEITTISPAAAAAAAAAAVSTTCTESRATISFLVTVAQAANVSVPHVNPRQAEPLSPAELSSAHRLIRRPERCRKWTHRAMTSQRGRSAAAACPVKQSKFLLTQIKCQGTWKLQISTVASVFFRTDQRRGRSANSTAAAIVSEKIHRMSRSRQIPEQVERHQDATVVVAVA